MNLRKRLFLLIFLLVSFVGGSLIVEAQNDSKVYGVLFFSPSCPHCHQVILEDLPPIQEQFGDDLVVFMFDVTTADGQAMAQSAYEYYSIPRGDRGVPMMIINEQVLVGSIQIPTQLPTITENGLRNGGIPVPQFPLMLEAYEQWRAQSQPVEAVDPVDTETVSPFQAILEHDPVASVVTIAILAGLVISVVGIGVTRRDGFPLFVPQLMVILSSVVVFLLAFSILLAQEINMLALVVISLAFVGVILVSGLAVFGERVRVSVVVLTVVGLVISAYMAYIELTANPAVCGAIGDCNAVQQSEYAFIMGVPIGVIGLVGYVCMLGLSLMVIFAPIVYRSGFVIMLQIFVIIAGIFTIYLTFLEPFVIGAVCTWCLLSALVVMNLMWLVLPMVRAEETKVTHYLTHQPI